MNPFRSTLFILAGLLFCSIPDGYAQESVQKPDLKFERIHEGLISNRISAIYQDSYGFMWIGTYSGLHRYDGIQFHVYTSGSDTTSISDNYIGDIYEDSENNLWFGTISSMVKYNRDTDDFTRFELPNHSQLRSGESALVNSILEDEDQKLWVGGGGEGLYYFDSEKQEFIHFEGFGRYQVNSITAGNNHTIWIATLENGLGEVNTKTGDVRFHKHDPANKNSIVSNAIEVVKMAPDNNLWIGTRGLGLNRMVMENGNPTFYHYQHQAENPNSLGNNDIFTLYVDNSDDLWVGNENGGLHLYNNEDDSFFRFERNLDDPTSISHNSIWSIFQDQEDRYWIGTAHTGINLADPNGSKFAHYFNNPISNNTLNNDIIRNFWESEDGRIWIATDGGGLNVLDRQNNTFKAFQHDPENSASLGSDAVINLNEDNEGNLWVGTWAGGLNILLDEQEGTFTTFNKWINNSEHPIRSVFDVHFDDSSMWIAAFEEGLYRYNKTGETLELFTANPEDPTSLVSSYILRIFEDSKNNLWIGTQEGLNLLKSENKEDVTFNRFLYSAEDPHSIAGRSIRQIFEDSNKEIWFATDRGLSKYVEQEDRFENYYQADGLPANDIRSIIEDDNNHLWIGTIQGISHFNPKEKTFTNYHTRDGLQSNEFSRYSVHKTRNGELLFGGTNGFNLFHPDDLSGNPHPPKVYLTDLKLFNKSVSIKDPTSPLQKHISATDTLTLSHRESVITFDFIALNYTRPENNQYAYMIEGFENEWNYVGTQRHATYTNLDPGEYLFRVKASNNDGVWNEEGTSLRLIITPPFWQTSWFYLFSILFIGSVLISGYRIRVRNIRELNKKLKQIVDERTTELKKTNKELKKHINEKDKLLSIIGHDLRNPFASIIGYMDLLKDEFKKEQNSDHFNYVSQILNVSRSTYNLLENLLQWANSKTGVLEMNPEVIEVNPLVENALNMVNSQASFKNITIEKALQGNAIVYADKNMIQTVLRNLISNAIKFSEENSMVKICVEEKNNSIITSVSDEGVGMSEEDLEIIFSEKNLQRSGTMNETGTGLGLVLCYEFIQKHKGSIWVESTLGKGSTFYFSLDKYSSNP